MNDYRELNTNNFYTKINRCIIHFNLSDGMDWIGSYFKKTFNNLNGFDKNILYKTELGNLESQKQKKMEYLKDKLNQEEKYLLKLERGQNNDEEDRLLILFEKIILMEQQLITIGHVLK